MPALEMRSHRHFYSGEELGNVFSSDDGINKAVLRRAGLTCLALARSVWHYCGKGWPKMLSPRDDVTLELLGGGASQYS